MGIAGQPLKRLTVFDPKCRNSNKVEHNKRPSSFNFSQFLGGPDLVMVSFVFPFLVVSYK